MPNYNDREKYGGIARDLLTHSQRLTLLLDTGATPQSLYEGIQRALSSVAKARCARARHTTNSPMAVAARALPLPPFNPDAPEGTTQRARPAVPADIVDQLRVAKRLFARSRFLRRKGHAAAMDAADALRLAARRQARAAQAALRHHLGGEPDRAARLIAKAFTDSSALWHRAFKADAADSYSTSASSIPCSREGRRPEDTFPAAARALFSGPQPDPPAIRPDAGDVWLRHVPRPRVALPPEGALGQLFSWQEIWWVLFGHTRHAPPTPCQHSSPAAGGPTSCARCMEERAQFDAAAAGQAEGLGHSINTSVAAGADGVPAELLSWARHKDFDPTNDGADGGATTAMRSAYCRALATLFNGMMQTGTVPPNFTEAIVTLVRKEAKAGEAMDYSSFVSYRPISCINTTHKILKLALVRRISHFCSAAGLLGAQQAGFSHRLATEHDIFVLLEALRRRMAIPGSRTWALFVDVQRAYDTVSHAAMIKVLETVGIGAPMCGLIRNLLADASFRLDINGGLSEPISLDVGLPQGDPLSPILFLLYVESLCRGLDEVDVDLDPPPPLTPLNARQPPPPDRRRGLMTVGQLLRDLLYADDIAALAGSFDDLVRVRRVLEEWGAAWGLSFNPKVGKTEYILFAADAASGFHFPTLTTALHRKGRSANLVFFPPIPEGNPPIPFDGAPGWGDNSHYRYLGVDLTSTLNWTGHWDRAVRGSLIRYNTIAFHRSSIMARMTTARLLQLRKIYLQPYAWSCLPVPVEVLAFWDTFLHSTGAAALRCSSKNASSLLTECLSATPSADALLLRERLRLFLQLRSHVSRKAPPGFPRHASVMLFDALLEEFRGWLRLRTPNPPPNWIWDLASLLETAEGYLPPPLRLNLLDLGVEWSFQIKDFLRPFIVGVTYFHARCSAARGIQPADLRMGPESPRTDGPTRAALSLSFGLSADAARFAPDSRPLPLSLLGPGCHHIATLATDAQADEVLRAIRGNSCLRLQPWVGSGADGRALPPPVPPGTGPLAANWNAASGCPLCAATDGIPHIFGLCPHAAVAAVRATVVRHALSSFLPFLVGELRRLRLSPADSGAPLELLLSAEEEAALLSFAALDADGVLSNELRHILFRLVTASPWPRRVAQRGHHLASALGALFDAVIAAPQSLRHLANRWMQWSKLAITKVAKARLRALEEEVRAPSQPRPPPWVRPAAPPAAPGGDAELDDGVAPPPPPARAPRALPPPSFPACTVFHGPMIISWYRRCNRAALVHLYGRVRADLALSARLPPGAPATGEHCTVERLAELLFGLSLNGAAIGGLGGIPAAPLVAQ